MNKAVFDRFIMEDGEISGSAPTAGKLIEQSIVAVRVEEQSGRSVLLSANEECSPWPGLTRLQILNASILDWTAVLYKGLGKVIVNPSNPSYRPFYIRITANQHHSILRIQRFEIRSAAAFLSLGMNRPSELEPKDVNSPCSVWYFAANKETANIMRILDICQVIRDEGPSRAEKRFSISKVCMPLYAGAVLPMKACFQMEFSTVGPYVEQINMQLCDENTEDGSSILMDNIGRHMRARSEPLYPACLEWNLVSDIIARVHSKYLYNPIICTVGGISRIQPSCIFEEMVIATAPDLARRTLGYPNPYLCILGYEKEKLICIQVFHSVQSRIHCHEHPEKKFPKFEIWIGVDSALPAFLRLLRIQQVIEAGWTSSEYAKRAFVYSADAFSRDGHLPTNDDRAFVLPFGHGTKLEFAFIQFSSASVGYGKFACDIGALFEKMAEESAVKTALAISRNQNPLLIPTASLCIPVKAVEQAERGDKVTKAEPERWAWVTQQG